MFFFNQNCPIFILKNWDLKKFICSVNSTSFAIFLGEKSQISNIRKIEKTIANVMIMSFSEKKSFLILVANQQFTNFQEIQL
jgi:hypothetical protein